MKNGKPKCQVIEQCYPASANIGNLRHNSCQDPRRVIRHRERQTQPSQLLAPVQRRALCRKRGVTGLGLRQTLRYLS